MRTILLGLLFLITSQASAQESWGDEVTRCIVQKNKETQLSSSAAIEKYNTLCERAVENARQKGSREFKGPPIMSIEKMVEIAREAQETERAEARRKWHDCVYAEAIALDDGVTQAADIGSVVRFKCTTEHQRFFNTFDFRPDERKRLLGELPDLNKQIATRAILEWRSYLREAK